jgi:fatty acid-binding protein DegV
MADTGTNNFLVAPNHDVKVLRLQVLIQEKKSRIKRLNQDIEDLTEMAIKSKQAEVKMLELELDKLTSDLTNTGNDADIIDV